MRTHRKRMTLVWMSQSMLQRGGEVWVHVHGKKKSRFQVNRNSLCLALKIRKGRHVWKIANNPICWIVGLRLEKFPRVTSYKILCANIRLALMLQMNRFLKKEWYDYILALENNWLKLYMENFLESTYVNFLYNLLEMTVRKLIKV